MHYIDVEEVKQLIFWLKLYSLRSLLIEALLFDTKIKNDVLSGYWIVNKVTEIKREKSKSECYFLPKIEMTQYHGTSHNRKMTQLTWNGGSMLLQNLPLVHVR